MFCYWESLFMATVCTAIIIVESLFFLWQMSGYKYSRVSGFRPILVTAYAIPSPHAVIILFIGYLRAPSKSILRNVRPRAANGIFHVSGN